jgi:CDP-diacylglycerol--serine O-phosphatidyltransferase
MRFIPNFITSLNLLAGALSIVLAFEGFPLYSAYLIFIAAIFDFLDGFVARAINAYSDMGKELDSLADLISFGMAPAAVVFNLMKSTFFLSKDLSDFDPLPETNTLIFLSIPLLIPVFSGLRLAKFNVDTRQTSSFIGLPTPANAIFWASLPIIALKSPMYLNNIIGHIDYVPFALAGGVVIMSLLLVSELPMFSLKFKTFSFKENIVKYVFLLLSLALLIYDGFKSIPTIIILYIVISLLLWIINKFKK